ncbi:MAG: VanW family protein [Candidatus Paceibacterota bacterium]
MKWSGIILLSFASLLLYGFIKDSQTKFLPQTTIAGQLVGGLTTEESLKLLSDKQLVPPEHTVKLVAPITSIASTSAQLGASYQIDQQIKEVLTTQQAKPADWFYQLLLGKTTQQYDLPIIYSLEKLTEMVDQLKEQTDEEPYLPTAKLATAGVASSLIIDKGKNVFALQTEATLDKLKKVLEEVTISQLDQSDGGALSVSAVTTTSSQQLTDEQTDQARQRATNLVGKKIILGEQETRRTLSDIKLIYFLQLPDGYRVDLLDELLTDWETELNHPPANAEFTYDSNTLRVEKFVPHRNGLTLNREEIKQNILNGLYELEHTDLENLTNGTLTKELVLHETPPEITLENTNNLGIKERIGFGESYYYHSIPNRIYNVSLTTGRINLAIVPPGKEFSFNQTLGEVSAGTGFRPAYVIKDGQTLLGDGGGVCQVSTTLFRALLDAGLHVTRRLQHSYRVSYYELDRQPGFDATVYAGNVDLRFINDTDHHILIYGRANPDSLYMTMEIYGTSDGRTTEITNYKTWDSRGPLAPVYIPDASLAPGTLRQVDWAASGIKAQFTHIIRDRSGEITGEKTYYSNYQPWAAKFLQGI